MRKLMLSLSVVLTTAFVPAVAAGKAKVKVKAKPIAPMNEYVTDLMSRMTLQEKIGQLNLMVAGDITTGGAMDTQVGGDIANGNMGGVFNIKGFDKIKALQEIAVTKSRLGIPLLVGMDVIHGYETMFPIPLALSCSWNLDAIKQSAALAAKEASADGINWTYSPMVDVALDARWGRVSEGSGEDPYLGARIAEAMVQGYQGTNYSNKDNIMACLKHFALYGAVESGLEYNTTDMSRLRMYNQYFAPYEAAVKAGVGSVMSSFNLVDYVPATANRWLLTDVLRNDWKFDGFVVTDYGSIAEIIQHGTAANLKEASAQALNAGTDMDMCSNGFVATLAQSVAEGKVSEATINEACRRVLEAKYKLGLFANPYKYCDAKRHKTEVFTNESRQTARDIAAQTFVLLKNDHQLLPLKKEGSVALIGPLADTRNNMAGTWSVAQTPDRYATLRESMAKALEGKAKLLYAQGCNVWYDEQLQKNGELGKTIARGDDAALKAEALNIAQQADVIVCAMGETADMSGECATRTSLEMPDAQHALLEELVKLGKPVVLLNFAGRPTVLSWETKHVPAIMNVWFGGSEAADAICDVLFGDKVPVGRLTMSMPKTTGQAPLYYNHLNTGRPVADNASFAKFASNALDVSNGALYPFGYGLSYTTFSYSDVTLSANEMAKNSSVTATVTVTNTGKRDADEVVQLYVHDLVASIVRPVKELKGFERIHLAAGESKTVTFTIGADQLSFYNADLKKVVEPGDFDIMVGSNSRDVKKARLTVKNNKVFY
ncbi:beta-glucosidase BglX [uncultured Prevotella sp.]|uniref:beta-glucosidase BglX n=1 Tax=uncultured Prevotella sp. TaxID=159272 RepID=UPI00261761B2|nr:beta-glucosidase BglX [uncultured Prevotella sp.]